MQECGDPDRRRTARMPVQCNGAATAEMGGRAAMPCGSAMAGVRLVRADGALVMLISFILVVCGLPPDGWSPLARGAVREHRVRSGPRGLGGVEALPWPAAYGP